MNIDLDTITLLQGAHDTRDDGVCLLEAVAWFAGEPHTDHPACVSPVLGDYGRALNDLLPQDKRQQLRPLIPLLPGTADDGLDEARGYLALDWLIHVYAPAWLELAGLTDEASVLRDFGRISDRIAVRSVVPHVMAARDKARAAWYATGNAAGYAVGSTAWDTAGYAADYAAGSAAWAAAGYAAWGTLWDTATYAPWDAVADAARDAARYAAGSAAWDATRHAAGDADAALAAARHELEPVTATLQDSAISLCQQMISPGSVSGSAK